MLDDEGIAHASDNLVRDILRDVLVDAAPPPQIVPIPEPDFVHSTLTVVVPEQTMRVLTALAAVHGTNPNAVARSVLNVVSAKLANFCH